MSGVRVPYPAHRVNEARPFWAARSRMYLGWNQLMELVTNIIGYTAAAIGMVMFLPQTIKSWKTKQTKDLSFLTYFLFAIVSLLWFIYGLLLKAGPIIVVNATLLILNVF